MAEVKIIESAKNNMLIYPPMVAGLYLLAAWVLSLLFPIIDTIKFPYNLIGLVVLVIGFGLMFWAAQLFHQQGTTHNPHGLPKKLVTTGPYQFTRNPMYLGQLLMSIGITVLAGNLYFFLAPVAFALTVNKFFIPKEEQKLERIFRSDYLNYKNQVRRWI